MYKNNPAPIAVFCYNRVDHLARTIESLRKNQMAAVSSLFIFSDEAKNASDREAVDAVRRYIDNIHGFKETHVIYREINYGLAKSIISGINTVLRSFDRLIVLEDDMISSPHFLTYMNEALHLYYDDDRVACIHGYTYPCEAELPEAFFLRGADCWGWGTWRRGWDLMSEDGESLLKKIKAQKLQNEFDFDGAYRYTQMLKDQIRGKNNSWAILWYASTFIHNKLCLYPGRSLIHNIGNDDSGTHSSNSTKFDTTLSVSRIKIQKLEVVTSELARDAFVRYFRKSRGSPWASAIRFIRSRLT